VNGAKVTVGDETIGEIGPGLLVLLGVHAEDADSDIQYICDKILNLRVFEDGEGKMNLSVKDTGGGVLMVSQFTLYGDARKGRRPSFTEAADPVLAERLYRAVVNRLRDEGLNVPTGAFGAHMVVALENDGPVTLLLDSRRNF
jgi:D-tyrosyl-tRNA(Tyr) deacylase